MERLFTFANMLVMPIWALMIVAPRGRLTGRLLASPFIVLPLVALYALLVLPNAGNILPLVARPQLGPIATLLGSPSGATAAWLHFLAFDLFVGRWVLLDAQDRLIPSVQLSATLLLTLLLGPIGLVVYGAMRERLTQRSWQAIKTGLSAAAQGSYALLVVGIGSLLTAAVSLVLQAFDPRQLLDASVWLKPFKFGTSIAIVSFTLAWLLRVLDVPERARRRAVGSIAGFTAMELALITFQAARGRASHFNYGSLHDAIIFQVMGVGITIVTIALGYIGVRSFRTQYQNPALGAGIRSGFVIVLLGSLSAFLMTSPTSKQLTSLLAGERPAVIGGHAVGASEGGTGLPITHWSDQGGDLRVPHFIGLHGLQVMPLLGWWLSRRRNLRAALAARLTWIAAAGYLGLMLTTLLQALRAQPLLAPDRLTLLSAGAVVAACASAGAWAWWQDEKQAARAEQVGPQRSESLTVSSGCG